MVEKSRSEKASDTLDRERGNDGERKKRGKCERSLAQCLFLWLPTTPLFAC